MLIYIDYDYKCHVSDDGTRRTFNVPFFDGKCTAFIEGYRYVPVGEIWHYKGTDFRGEMVSPCTDYTILSTVQQAAEEVQEQADEQIMELLDIIEELIIGG